MNKLKIFVAASMLVLTTAGILAGSSPVFHTPPNLYIGPIGGLYFRLASGAINGANLQYGVSGTPVVITGSIWGPLLLVTYIPSYGYEQVVTTTF